MPTAADVTGVIVDPASVERSAGAAPLNRDTITVTKTFETVEADRIAKAAEIAEAERRTAGQRQVNMVWEYTQAAIAIMVVVACIGAAFVLDATRAEILRNAFFLIVGFYFGRTNHQTSGGVGTHEPFKQAGR